MNFPDLKTMQSITTARRLYQPKNANLSADEYLELNRRFAEGYVKMKDHPTIKYLELQLGNYNAELQKYGLKDYQVREIELEDTYFKYIIAVVRIIYMTVLLVTSFPGLLLNFPIGALAKNLSTKEAVASKLKSDVKIEGKDVIASYKMLVGVVIVPIVWTVYALILWILRGWNPLFTYPFLFFFSYASVRVAEEGVVVWLSSVPFLHALTQKDYRERIQHLHDIRQQLKTEVRKMVEDLGPQLGSDFWEKRIVNPEEIAKEEELSHSPAKLHLKFERSKYRSLTRKEDFSDVMGDLADELGIKE